MENENQEERLSLVANYFCQGVPPGEIAAKLKKVHNIELNNPGPWKLLNKMAEEGRFRYIPTVNETLRQAIVTKYLHAGLNRVSVFNTLSTNDLAYHSAELLLNILSEHHSTKSEVHIGFAGGGTLLEVARCLGELLRDPRRTAYVPRRLVFHSMVAGWNTDEPDKDPNSFSIVLAGDSPSLEVEIGFVGFHAPGIVPRELYPVLRGLDGIREAYEATKQIDIIVTSAGRWDCGHSALYRLYNKYSAETRDMLTSAGCEGDIMWCPIDAAGPIDMDKIGTPLRNLTLMQLSELHEFIHVRGKHVLLTLGLCSSCNKSKARVLQTVLGLSPQQRFVTHLVCDSRSAQHLIT